MSCRDFWSLKTHSFIATELKIILVTRWANVIRKMDTSDQGGKQQGHQIVI